MNSILIMVAATLPLLLGAALIASFVSDRRQTALRDRIGHSIGMYTDLNAGRESVRLDEGASAESTSALDWLPLSVGARIQAALGATGDRVTLMHVAIVASIGALPVVLVAGRLLSLNSALVLLLATGAAILLPMMFVKYMQGRFQTKFFDALPDALDLIVRAVRAGLPVGDAIETVASEVTGPVGDEFRRVHEGVTIGLELEQELLRSAERIRLVEFRFFIVSLTLQRRTGGNLAETLENLSRTIRRRKEVRLKARALMSESRASAWVIGALPFFVGAVIDFINPSYIHILFDDPRGRVVLGTAIASLVLGVITMTTMIRQALK